MKTTALTTVLCLAAIAPVFADGTNVLSDDKSRLSYAVGMTFGYRWKQMGLDVDGDLVARGLKDVQSGGPTLMTQQEMRDTMNESQQKLVAAREKKRQEIAAKNKQEGEMFLALNKKQAGVVTLPDGLQYKIITDGNGPIPTPDDVVNVNYRGTFVDGTEFDNSAKAGRPAQLRLADVIPGWKEALTRMKTGSKWRLFVPAELAYGQYGKPTRIEPNSVLIIETELLSIEPPQPRPAPTALTNAPITSDIIKVPSLEEMKKGAKIETIKAEDVQKWQQPQTQEKK